MLGQREAVHLRLIPAFRLITSILVALTLAVLASCGGGGGGSSSPPPSNNPVPSITGLSPSSATTGAAAQTLTISGTNFMSSSTVTYNNVAHTATYASSTQLTISLSASDQATAGSFEVVVTNPSPGGGASNSMNFTVNNPLPTITSLSPSSATAGAAAHTLTINGTNLFSSSTVTYNGVAHNAAYVSSTQLTISLSADDQATAGSYSVVVTNPSPGGGPSNSVSFAVTLPMPVFSTTAAQNAAVILTISSTASGAAVHYTIDGSTPTTSSPTYQTPMLISSNLTINAIATASGVPSSSVATWAPSTTVEPGALVWDEEFNNTSGGNIEPDGNWVAMTGNNNGWGNQELEDYCGWHSSESPCDSTKPNFFVDPNGYLNIVAEQTPSRVYTSARLTSQELFSILYGRVEARIQVPEAQGLWPAFWMLGNDLVTDGWPACGELDIQERWDAPSWPWDWTQGVVHGTGFKDGLATKYYFPSGQTAAGWHTYGMIWRPGSVQYYVDDPTNIYATYTPAIVTLFTFDLGVWPFDLGNAQFFIINLAVGGTAPGSPDSTTPASSTMLVDYVRVYAYGTPDPTLPTVSSLSFDPTTLAAGGSTTGTITLSGNAPNGGAAVSLSSNNSNLLSLPAGGVTIPAGSTSATFTATPTQSVTTTTAITVNATYNSSSQVATVTLATSAGGDPVPSISSLSPSSLAVGAPPQVLTINGTGFLSISAVTFNGIAHAAAFVSSTQLTISLTASDLATAGGFPVVVTNPAPGGGVSNMGDFTVTSASTATVSVSPSTIQLPPNGVQQFTATVTGTSNTVVNWAVSGVAGGNSSLGTITSSGVYTAPATVPTPATITVAATSQAVSTASGSASVTIHPYTLNVLYSFTGGSDGEAPSSELIFDAAGNLYGTAPYGGNKAGICTLAGCGTVFMLSPTSSGDWTETTLYAFQGGSDGGNPSSGLIFDKAGNLYGTAQNGGLSGGNCSIGCGTVFMLSPSSGGGWTESVLYTFQGGTDGENPSGPLTFDTAGNLYGATSWGGDCSFVGYGGCGTVFELSPTSGGTWTESVLDSFQGNTDEASPNGGLVLDQSGNLYGTTEGGFGANEGTVFELTPSPTGVWTEIVLSNDLRAPSSGLVFDTSGNLYGETNSGGSSPCIGVGTEGAPAGCGTIFEMSPTAGGGWAEQMLYSFQGATDGAYPGGGLIFDKAGNLFGTANSAGNLSACDQSGCGTVFELVPTSAGMWSEVTLYAFQGAGDGAVPSDNLVMDANGNFYGTASAGGAYNYGVVFELIP